MNRIGIKLTGPEVRGETQVVTLTHGATLGLNDEQLEEYLRVGRMMLAERYGTPDADWMVGHIKVEMVVEAA